MMKQWKRLAALSSAIVMAAATLTYFPSDTLQNIRLEISASAETTTEPQVWIEDNLTWTLTADGTLTISGTGAMKDYNAAENLSPAYMNSDVKKVVIEDGVTSIGELAFYKCSSLTNITIPDSVTCIEYAAFHGCSSLSSITIPNSVTSIGIYAFVVCSSLTSITIPDGVTSIGYGAFSDCSSLKTISLSCKSSLKKSDFGEQADLVSYTNQHTLTKTEAKAATCTENGNKEYWTCEHCKKYFLSDDTNPATATAVELSETVIPALKHKNATTRGAVEPTETAPGYSGDLYCPDCDKVVEKGYTYWNEDNLTWKLDADGTLTISGTGAMKDYDYYNNPSPASQKKDSVKKVVIEDGVTSIRNSAFYDCNSLTSITIPNSVTSIGAYAFSNCYYLTNITIPNSVTSIENYAFRSCSSLTSITIPDSVTSIGELAFYSCDRLTSITISNSVTSIGERAFAYCSRLNSITIPDSVTSIGEAAFAGCSSLTSITIPDSVTSIGEYAFQSCSSLTSITIPDSVTSIGDYVFISCSSLTTISLSCKSSLKRSDFGGQADLVSYTLHTLKKTEAKAATCTEDGNKEYWTCEHCGKYFLSDDANPETAKAVEQSETILPASHKLTKVKEEKAPTCTEDGNKEYWTCEHCKKYFLSDDTNPETAKAVELSETILPAIQHKNAELRNASEPTETSPGYSGDRYCPDCDKVVEKGYTYWNEGNLTWKLYEDGTLNISGTGAMKNYYDNKKSPVYNNSNVKKVVIEDGVTSIGNYAFTYCVSLTSITIPDSVTSIGYYAFFYCRSLTSITISDSVTSIGNYAFFYCRSLTSITIPDSVTSIGSYAFSECRSLTSITIPDSVTSIGRYAFENCSSLKTISLGCGSALKKSDFGKQADLVSYTSHVLKKTEAKAATCTENGNKEYWTCEHCGKYFLSDDANPETAKAVELSETILPAIQHKNAELRNASEPTETSPGYSGDLYCPDCDTVLEKGYTYWKEDNLTWKLDADGTLTISGTGAMKNYDSKKNRNPVYNNSNVKKVVIEDGVTSIGNYAFTYCVSLTSITIPDSVTSIGYYAFFYCRSLTSITISDSVTSIGNYAFFYCRSLTSITIPDSVTSIGNDAFSNCRSLTSITIPDSVTSIGYNAFYGCSNLKTISLSCKSSLKRSDFGGQADLVSYTSHTLTKTEAKAATCTEDGNKEYWTCEYCKKYFLSDDTNPETAKAVEQSETVIPASHKLTKVDAKAVTCAENGNKEYWTCEHCGKYFLSDDANPETAKAVEQSETIIPASHKLTKVKEEKAPTCTEDGNKAYWTCEHCGKYFLSDDSNPETAKAVELSETILPAIQHKNAELRNASEPTETSPGYSGDLYCPDCDKVVEKGYTYWNEDNLTWKLYEDGKLTISGTGTMKDYDYNNNPSPANQKKGSVKKVVIKDGVTSIGNYAFYNCTSLTSITIPDSVTSIGNNAFYNCTSLTSITIPDRVTSIGNYAFEWCNKLSSITLSNNITSIGTFAFNGCSSLTSITIPDSVTSIGNYAFYDCNSLTSVTIPDSVTSIGYNAFGNCSSLKTISLSCGSALKKSDFGDQANLVSYTNQHLLTKTAAKDATCTEDGNKEYWTCEHCGKYFLSDDTNPETAKAVELSETILPAIQHKNAELRNASEPTETSPGYSGDLYCPDCDKVLEKGYTYWNEGNLTWKLDADGTLTISGTGAMKDYNADDNPSPVYKNSNVKKIVIENSVTSIGELAFYKCSSLTNITIPGNVESIGESAFYSCDNLTDVTLQDGVKSIGNAAFIWCNNLTNIVLPNSVTSIGYFAFKDCTSLTSIKIPDSVTSIGSSAFENCSSLTSITIPDSVTVIGRSAFAGCGSLTSITIPDSVTSIGNYAFYDCKSLTSITIPDSVTSIGESVFGDCSNLTTISLSCGSVLKKSDFGDQANLVSYTSHTLKKTEAKAATYAENGNKEYWTCEHCGKYFLSDDTNPETAKAVELSETVIPALVQIATTTTPIKCVYGQDMNKIDLRDYVKNTDVVGEVTVKVATGSTLPDGMKLDNGKISGKPAKAYEDSKEVTFTFTAENGSTANLTLLFLVEKADPTVEVAVSGDSHTEGDLVSELKLILSENSTKGVVELVSEIKALVAGKNTFTWKFTPEDENNYNTITGTVVVNAQTTTTTTTKATTTTTKATTTTKPSKTTTTTKATTTTKPNKTTTTKATTTTKPSKTTTTTKATTTTKPKKTTTTKVTTTTKPSKTTTTKVTTTTKPSKTTTTKVTTTTVTTTTKPSKTTTTNATTTNTAIPSYGDVNLDGKVDILDAVFLNKYLATLIQFSDAQMANADCCQDGVLNAQDTTALMQFIILLIDDLPVQPTEK